MEWFVKHNNVTEEYSVHRQREGWSEQDVGDPRAATVLRCASEAEADAWVEEQRAIEQRGIVTPCAEPQAIENSYGWSVMDPDGSRWWPNDEASAEIEAAEDPAAKAIEICTNSPMRGEWHS